MSAVRAGLEIGEGYEALSAGRWEDARAAFAAALDHGDAPEALDGLGRALWWLRDAEAAVAYRERAYAGFRRQGDLARAARIALWLSREYALVWRNDAAANGWLARAERLLGDVAPGAERGWLDLTKSERALDGETAVELAAAALEVAHESGDSDLELRALAQLGAAEIRVGRVDEGLARFDEAMAGATGGEPTALETFADVCCSMLAACEAAGDDERPRQWSQVVEAFVRRYDHVPLLAFCRSCCADVFVATGRIDDAEHELVAALRELTEAGQRARCVHPAARLAEIRVLQGRFAEAEELLVGFEEEPEAVDAAVSLRLARGEPDAAAALLERRLAEVPGGVLAAPLLSRLVEAELARDRVPEARASAARLAEIAASAGRERLAGLALLAQGRVAVAAGDDEAEALLQQAVAEFSRLRLPLEAARSRLELARALAAASPEVAVDVARRAHDQLDGLGARRDADEAAALLRRLGAKGRSGPRSNGALSRRETEVLRLLGEGLSNAEIAQRLFISPKTAEHHVGRIYAKLDLRSRGEAAAYAVRSLGAE
jgi:DNA-binding CsgD family transcriptional regulator